MAKYIVIAVDDNTVATSLMVKLLPLEPKGVKVVGLFARPRAFCRCVGVGRKTNRAYTRGTKLGWWVCSDCHKPGRQWGSNPQAVISQAVNQLEVVDG